MASHCYRHSPSMPDYYSEQIWHSGLCVRRSQPERSALFGGGARGAAMSFVCSPRSSRSGPDPGQTQKYARRALDALVQDAETVFVRDDSNYSPKCDVRERRLSVDRRHQSFQVGRAARSRSPRFKYERWLHTSGQINDIHGLRGRTSRADAPRSLVKAIF